MRTPTESISDAPGCISFAERRTSEGPEVVGDAVSGPTDPDDDGLYEDIDGDGEVTDADGELLFERFEESAVQDNPESYDFNGNGRLDSDDIVEWRKGRDN